VQLTKVSLRL